MKHIQKFNEQIQNKYYTEEFQQEIQKLRNSLNSMEEYLQKAGLYEHENFGYINNYLLSLDTAIDGLDDELYIIEKYNG